MLDDPGARVFSQNMLVHHKCLDGVRNDPAGHRFAIDSYLKNERFGIVVEDDHGDGGVEVCKMVLAK
jgi:hypothetical protein